MSLARDGVSMIDFRAYQLPPDRIPNCGFTRVNTVELPDGTTSSRQAVYFTAYTGGEGCSAQLYFINGSSLSLKTLIVEDCLTLKNDYPLDLPDPEAPFYEDVAPAEAVLLRSFDISGTFDEQVTIRLWLEEKDGSYETFLIQPEHDGPPPETCFRWSVPSTDAPRKEPRREALYLPAIVR